MNRALARQRAGGGAKRGAVVSVRTIPAPIGGLNARDSIAEMKETDAVILDNIVPGTSNVRLRPGYVAWATGISGNVESLLPYRSGTGNKLFAAAGGSIYDATTQGAVGAPVVTGLTTARFQYVNFGTPGGQFLIAANSADPIQRFNGSTWFDANASPAITGVDTRNIFGVNAYGERLWLLERNSFRVWYLPLQSIGGAATELDLSSLFRLGGAIAAMITWTVAGSTNSSQYAVFVSTEGEVIIFAGDDPANADTWARAGQARIGRPIGSRFWTRVGTDVVLICADGFVPLSQVLQVDRKSNSDAISNKIVNLASQATGLYAGHFGWQVTLFPGTNKLIINVPQQEAAVSFQYVMNTLTGAWCRYIGINAFVWEATQDSLFFGTAGGVFKAETGADDAGNTIVGVMLPAFSYFGDQALTKRFTQVRIVTEAEATFDASISLLLNFDQSQPPSTPTLIPGADGSPWNVSAWDVSNWSQQSRMGYGWQTVGGFGFCASVHMVMSRKGVSPAIDAITYVFERGGLY